MPNRVVGGVKVGSRDDVKQSIDQLKPAKPINLFKKRKSP